MYILFTHFIMEGPVCLVGYTFYDMVSFY